MEKLFRFRVPAVLPIFFGLMNGKLHLPGEVMNPATCRLSVGETGGREA